MHQFGVDMPRKITGRIPTLKPEGHQTNSTTHLDPRATTTLPTACSGPGVPETTSSGNTRATWSAPTTGNSTRDSRAASLAQPLVTSAPRSTVTMTTQVFRIMMRVVTMGPNEKHLRITVTIETGINKVMVDLRKTKSLSQK